MGGGGIREANGDRGSAFETQRVRALQEAEPWVQAE